jgi:hypothetical protein
VPNWIEKSGLSSDLVRQSKHPNSHQNHAHNPQNSRPHLLLRARNGRARRFCPRTYASCICNSTITQVRPHATSSVLKQCCRIENRPILARHEVVRQMSAVVESQLAPSLSVLHSIQSEALIFPVGGLQSVQSVVMARCAVGEIPRS